MSHKELVERAGKWLNKNHGVVCMEVVCYAPETPDAIGFNHTHSTVVECKASRADFLRDKKKWHRTVGIGMGNYRYYLCEPGVIKFDEVPERWGLLYCHPRRIEVVKPSPVGESETYQMMYSLMRRARVRGFNPNERLARSVGGEG